MTISVPPFVWQLCAGISTAETALEARCAVWEAIEKIKALSPREHKVASEMIRDAMNGRNDPDD